MSPRAARMILASGRHMTSPLLSMQGISKHFGGTPALTDASLEIGAGEVHALIGQNGAGKSTLIKILTGYYRRDAGRVTYAGAPFAPASPKAAQAAGISTIYQEVNLVPLLSVTENICLGRESRRFGLLDWRAMEREAARLLARFGIEVDTRRAVGSFSTATQQMIAIARATGFEARLVIMDEPTSSLDDRETQVLFDVIRGLKADGISVVFVSHRLDELYAVCDRVTIMRDGRTVRQADLSGIGKLELVSTMLGRDVERSAGRTTGFGRAARAPGERVLGVEALSDGHLVRDVSLDVREGRSRASRACSDRAGPRRRAWCSAWIPRGVVRCRSRVVRSARPSLPTRSARASGSAPRIARSRASSPT